MDGHFVVTKQSDEGVGMDKDCNQPAPRLVEKDSTTGRTLFLRIETVQGFISRCFISYIGILNGCKLFIKKVYAIGAI